ncbi:MAG: RluA family pseudouridine synthase [Pirellulales bacterium]|nr:RluA family pseudouridine synthase [Pirellulales bacterium]
MTPRAGDQVEYTVDPAEAGVRLDAFLAERFDQYSRVQLRKAIMGNLVKINGQTSPIKVAYRLRAGDIVQLTLPAAPAAGPQPEEIPLDLLYEDDLLAVVNKPPGMVVHPARGHWAGTLTSALAFHFEKLSQAGGPTRPGIVHRLDRDTSGVIIVAKTDAAHFALAEQFEQRDVGKEYFAIVVGTPAWDRDLIDQPIGIHPYQREKMAIRRDHATSRPAQTQYEVTERFDGFSALQLLPRTGRTHQIRVHLSHIQCPVLCDKLYGGRSQITRGELRKRFTSTAVEDQEVLLDRQALHARRITFEHPGDGRELTFTAPLPADLERILAELRLHRGI